MEKIPEKLTIEQMEKELHRREATRIGQQGVDQHCFELLQECLRVLKLGRPDTTGPKSRLYAIATTDMEKIVGYWDSLVMRGETNNG